MDLYSQLVTGPTNPEAVSAALAAVARVRAAIMSCRVIRAKEHVGPAATRLLAFATRACAEGLPDPTEESEAAWQLMQTSIACGLELLSISHLQEPVTSHTWGIHLYILHAAVEVWQAQLWQKTVSMFIPKLPELQPSSTAVSTAEHHSQLPNNRCQPPPVFA